MKLISLALGILISSAYAMDEKEFLQFNKKYCEKGVVKACETVKCMANTEECLKNRKPDPIAETQKKVVELKCGQDKECWMREAVDEEKRFRDVAEPLCARGSADYCYQIELLNTIRAMNSQE